MFFFRKGLFKEREKQHADDRADDKRQKVQRPFANGRDDENAAVSWTVDNQPVNDEVFTFTHAGAYKITAVIVYSDGSRETLTKILEVKE